MRSVFTMATEPNHTSQGILQARNCLWFFSLLRSPVFLCLRTLAPLSGQVLETDMDRQHSARKESRGKKWEFGPTCHAVNSPHCGSSSRLPILEFSWNVRFPFSKIKLKLSPFCPQPVLSIRAGSRPKQPATSQSLAGYFRLTLLLFWLETYNKEDPPKIIVRHPPQTSESK